MNYLEVIKEHGLMVRQIPLENRETYCANSIKTGRRKDLTEFEFFWREINLDGRFKYENLKEMHKGKDYFKFDDEDQKIFRHYATRVKANKNGGFWMCKKSTGTGSNIAWCKKSDCLAPTLEESVDLFLESIGEDPLNRMTLERFMSEKEDKMTVRLRNILKCLGYGSVYFIDEINESNFLRVRNAGKKSLEELSSLLSKKEKKLHKINF